MMRQIYITANGAVDATGWRGRPRRADSACRGSDSQTYLVRTSLRGRGGFLADVELRTIKEVDLKGGTVVAAFPSVGLDGPALQVHFLDRPQLDVGQETAPP